MKTAALLIIALSITHSAISGESIQSSMLVERQLVPNNASDNIFYFQNRSCYLFIKKVQTGIFPEADGYTIVSIKYADGPNAQDHIWVDFGYNPRGSSETFAGDYMIVLPWQTISIDVVPHYGTGQGAPAAVLLEVIMWYSCSMTAL